MSSLERSIKRDLFPIQTVCVWIIDRSVSRIEILTPSMGSERKYARAYLLYREFVWCLISSILSIFIYKYYVWCANIDSMMTSSLDGSFQSSEPEWVQQHDLVACQQWTAADSRSSYSWRDQTQSTESRAYYVLYGIKESTFYRAVHGRLVRTFVW